MNEWISFLQPPYDEGVVRIARNILKMQTNLTGMLAIIYKRYRFRNVWCIQWNHEIKHTTEKLHCLQAGIFKL